MKGKFAVTFGTKGPKLNSRLVYCSRLYSKCLLDGSGYWHEKFTLPIVKILNKESFDIFSDMAYTGFASISNCLILIGFVTLN